MTQLSLFTLPPEPSGVLWVTAGGRRVALVVAHGRVTEAWPNYLGRWAVGKSLAWMESRRPPQTRNWQPGVVRFRISARGDTRRLRRWQRAAYTSKGADLSLGRIGNSAWFVHQTGEQDAGWIYPTAGSAVAEVQVRLSSGGWTRVAANYDRSGQPKPDVDVPELGVLDAAWPFTGP